MFYNQSMKKDIRIIFILLILFNIQNLFAKNLNTLQESAKSILKRDFDVLNIFSIEISDDENWCFVNAETKSTSTNNVYAVNLLNPELSTIIFNNPIIGTHTVSDIAYNNENKTLYFIVNNGMESLPGIRTFETSGFYAISISSEGTFLPQNLRYYYRLEGWNVENVIKTYLKDTIYPNYKKFCKFFTDFSNPQVRDKAVFCVKDENGNKLFNEEAARYIHKLDKLDSFIYQTNEWKCFPLENHVFIADENGIPTDISAVSYYFDSKQDKNFFCGTKSITSSCSDLFFLNGTIYFTYNIGSFHYDEGQWRTDYSSIYKIRDDESGFYVEECELLINIKALPYEWSDKSESPINIIKDKKGKNSAVLINEVNGKSICYFDGFKVETYTSFDEYKNQNNKSNTVYFTFYFILLVFIIFFVIKTDIFNIFNRIIYRIQENEHEKIAADIHDSVVQDLRAIRIKTELLKVHESSSEIQRQIIDEITLCITKMRDICYGLSPAELNEFCSKDNQVNFYSIVNCLGNQFTVKTNIPCSVKFYGNKGEYNEFFLQKEDCFNLIRIIQEALKNIEKHSFATQAQILIQENKIFIIDNGRGCDLSKVFSWINSKNHFGLRMMKKRAKLIEGCQIFFLSTINDGMQVKIVLNKNIFNKKIDGEK